MEENHIIDRSWMYKYKTKHKRVNPDFLTGVLHFMEFAVKSINNEGTMKCPCAKCGNMFYEDKDTVHFHIVREGFTPIYTTWHFHGEARRRSTEETNVPIDSKDEELLKALDKRITQTNWEFWERDDKSLEATRNKKNRGEHRATHILGAKSIAPHNYDEEKVVATCVEKDVVDSSDPCILSPILDVVYKGHHGGYKRGRGLGWSRAVPWSKLEATVSNESIQHLTLELQNVRVEIKAMRMRAKELETRQMEQLEAMKVREREMQNNYKEMQARLERMEALLSIHFSNGLVGDSTSQGKRLILNFHDDRRCNLSLNYSVQLKLN